jgi:hypothetical protein
MATIKSSCAADGCRATSVAVRSMIVASTEESSTSKSSSPPDSKAKPHSTNALRASWRFATRGARKTSTSSVATACAGSLA